uniref:Uncharacterized protein n=1 Tax=Arundo donax TaxID=35708 RepID=A0A0A9B0G5_ARUDO
MIKQSCKNTILSHSSGLVSGNHMTWYTHTGYAPCTYVQFDQRQRMEGERIPIRP